MDPTKQDLEKICIQQANVTPHWLLGGDAFWYTRFVDAEKSHFILVDCATGTQNEAFDHVSLAAELRKHTDEDISPDSLPFWWINIARDGAWARFQFKGQTWQYEKDGKLQPWEGDLEDGDFYEGCAEGPSPQPSEQSNGRSTIIFANHTTNAITYSWLDCDGKSRYYGTIPAGQIRTQQSYIGHIWRLTAEDSDKSICCAVKAITYTAVIEELPFKLILRWETDVMTDTTTNKTEKVSHKNVLGLGTEPFVRDSNLWVKYPEGIERQLSYDGFVDNAFSKDQIYPSSDGRHVVAWQCKPGSKRVIHMVESSPNDQLQPKLKSVPYLKPGDNVGIERPRMFDIESQKEVPLEDHLFRNPYAITNAGWSQAGDSYRMLFNERGHQCLRLLDLSVSGTVRVLAENASKTFVDYHHKTYHKVMESSGEILWASEKDGWNHLYLYNLDGTLKNQVTKGNWVMRSVESVDEKKRVVWFRGLGMIHGQDPYYAHLACVNFDGSDWRVITKGDGTHTWRWSPDRRFLIDTWSRVDCPPQTVVRETKEGNEIVLLEQTHISEPEWQSPETFMAVGRDGQTEIHGVIIRPLGFDTSKKYAVLEMIYAGPQSYFAPKAFMSFHEMRKRLGQSYVLVQIDGMGTNWRSKAFHDVCYKNLKDAGFPDRIAWMRAAAKTRPWMDLSRVGCFGSSAGGHNAVAAMLHHGDFYKAACAYAGCHDNRMDKVWWNELWMGYPVDDSYRESSNVTHAHKLNGSLMLVVGELDTNVDPSSTTQLVNALINADKDFDFVFVPGGDHHVAKLPYVKRKQDLFFERYLLSLGLSDCQLTERQQ